MVLAFFASLENLAVLKAQFNKLDGMLKCMCQVILIARLLTKHRQFQLLKSNFPIPGTRDRLAALEPVDTASESVFTLHNPIVSSNTISLRPTRMTRHGAQHSLQQDGAAAALPASQRCVWRCAAATPLMQGMIGLALAQVQAVGVAKKLFYSRMVHAPTLP